MTIVAFGVGNLVESGDASGSPYLVVRNDGGHAVRGIRFSAQEVAGSPRALIATINDTLATTVESGGLGVFLLNPDNGSYHLDTANVVRIARDNGGRMPASVWVGLRVTDARLQETSTTVTYALGANMSAPYSGHYDELGKATVLVQDRTGRVLGVRTLGDLVELIDETAAHPFIRLGREYPAGSKYTIYYRR